MTLYTVLLFYSLSLSGRAGSGLGADTAGRHLPPDALLTPDCPFSEDKCSSTFRVSCLQILDQSFVSVFPASNAGTPGGEATALPSGLHASSCTHGSKGCPLRRPLLAGPHSGPEPQVSMLGWNKGVNIYNFIPVVRREGQQMRFFMVTQMYILITATFTGSVL